MKTRMFFERIKAVESEQRIAALAVGRFMHATQHEPLLLSDHGLRDRDVRECQRRLEGTYVIRLFAEFEIALRLIWQHVRHRPNPPRIQITQLMNAMVARHHVPTDAAQAAHDVREFRNDLVHEGPPRTVLTIAESRSRLCNFLKFMPHYWS